jgi:Chaperone of endosialidase
MGGMKTPTLTITSTIAILLPLACFALLPQARATCQEGCDLNNANTFLGDDALISNTTGGSNTATGGQALFSNTIGSFNTANGFAALNHNTSGNDNTATGFYALTLNSTGGNNTATGFQALVDNTTGSENTAIGWAALGNNTIGSGNIALGISAGHFTTGDSNIVIGNGGVGGESRTIRIGTKPTHKNTFIAGISGVTVPTGIPVIVDANGHLGTTTSSARFKDAIKPMDKGSEAILSLKPVTFRYKKDLDPNAIPQFGLVAEDVAEIDPDLVAKDNEGKPYTVRYEAVNAMLLNEFLKEHKKVEEQAKTAEEQASKIERLEAALEKMSARLDAKGL